MLTCAGDGVSGGNLALPGAPPIPHWHQDCTVSGRVNKGSASEAYISIHYFSTVEIFKLSFKLMITKLRNLEMILKIQRTNLIGIQIVGENASW